MKKKVFCAGALALWFLLFCTFFSLRVEDMMTPRVTVISPARLPNSVDEVLALDCLFQSENDEACLYTLYEGDGWEEGQRVTLVSPGLYAIDLERSRIISFIGSGVFLNYAAKPPLLGEKAQVIKDLEKGPDHWLAVCPGGMDRLRELPEGCGLEARTDTALLAAVEETPVPFMEARAMSQLFTTTVFDGEQETIYSLNDVEDFFSQIKILALLGGLLLFVVILLAWSFFLLRKPQKYKKCLLANGGVYLLSLIVMPLILNGVNLPQSLLPVQIIVDTSHYQAELSEIFSNLNQLAAQGSQTAKNILDSVGASLWVSAAILLACVLAACAVILMEKRAVSKRRAPRHYA